MPTGVVVGGAGQGGGASLISKEARSWLLQTQVSQMEWMCSQVAAMSSVYTVCSCRLHVLLVMPPHPVFSTVSIVERKEVHLHQYYFKCNLSGLCAYFLLYMIVRCQCIAVAHPPASSLRLEHFAPEPIC